MIRGSLLIKLRLYEASEKAAALSAISLRLADEVSELTRLRKLAELTATPNIPPRVKKGISGRYPGGQPGICGDRDPMTP
jgi:hypothetical protein